MRLKWGRRNIRIHTNGGGEIHKYAKWGREKYTNGATAVRKVTTDVLIRKNCSGQQNMKKN